MFFKSKGVRPFIITRSSTVGTSRYGFHWTGDNFADWSFLRESIPHILNCQMFGFQMVGADICGFGGDASE
jgi:alpha-glucosidase